MLIDLSLLLNVQILHELVFVVDFFLDFVQILGHFSISLLLEEVRVLIFSYLWCGEDVLHSIGDDVVLVAHQAHNRLVALLWDGLLLVCGLSVELLWLLLSVDPSIGLAEVLSWQLLFFAEAFAPLLSSLACMSTTLWLIVAAHVANHLAGSVIAEGRPCGSDVGRVFTLVTLALRSLILLRRYQVVD